MPDPLPDPLLDPLLDPLPLVVQEMGSPGTGRLAGRTFLGLDDAVAVAVRLGLGLGLLGLLGLLALRFSCPLGCDLTFDFEAGADDCGCD